MRKKQLCLLLALICIVIGYFSCGLALQNNLAIPAILYWSFFIAIPIISVLLITNNETCNVLILLTNSISVYSMFFLQNTTWYPTSRDTQFELQIVSLIYEHGVWIPGMGTGFGPAASLNPAMHIFLDSFCIFTGIQPYQAMFIIPWLKGVCFMLFFYLFARKLLTRAGTAFFASIVYLGTVWYMGFPHRQVFGEILFMGALWIYFRKKPSFGMKITLMLLVFSLTMSHHFTSYVFLLLVIALYLFDKKRRKEMIHPLLPLVSVLSWVTFTSLELTSTYMISFSEALGTALTLRSPEGPTLAATSYYYTPVENFILFMNPIMISSMAFPYFLKGIQNRKKNSLLIITFVLGALATIAILFFIFKTTMSTSFIRIWSFLYIPLSIWVSILFWKKFRNVRLRTIVSIAIIAMFFTSMNLSKMESGIKKWYVPREYMEAYMYSDSMVHTAQWCKDRLSGSILGDHFAFDMVGSWGFKEVDVWTFQTWYRTKDNIFLKMFDYIILSPLDKVTYLDTFREPIDPFSLLPKDLSVVYTSGDLIVYHNSNR